jgi:hypothetical protein
VLKGQLEHKVIQDRQDSKVLKEVKEDKVE